MPINICLIIVVLGQLGLVLALCLATEFFFNQEQKAANEFTIPEQYFDFFPNPEKYSPTEYLVAYENYLTLH